jgi:protein-tyrosine phosphatase
MEKKAHVLFVCMANICRSPAAEGVLKHFAKKYPDLNITVQSCGIGDWHIGASPDHRMQETSKARGIYLTSQARQFQKSFFDQFDFILASDKEVRNNLYHYATTPEDKAKIGLMTDYSPVYKGQEVPDPYYQAGGSFELVMDILEDSCTGLLEYIQSQKTSQKSI